VRLDAQVRRHASQDHLVDAPLAQLQHEVVGLGPIDFVWAGDHRVPVLDVAFVLPEPIRPGALEAIEAQRRLAIEHPDVVHQDFQRPPELPAVVGRVVVVGRHEQLVSAGLSRAHQPVEIGDRVVLRHALTHHAPGDTFGAEEVVLWVRDDDGGSLGIDLHAGVGELRGGTPGVQDQPGEGQE
jgi:hypothetical protein